MKRLLFFSALVSLTISLASCGPKPHGKNAGPAENMAERLAKLESMAKPTKSWHLQSQNCGTSNDDTSSPAAKGAGKTAQGHQIEMTLEITEGSKGDGGRISQIYSAGDDCSVSINGGYVLSNDELHLTVVSIEGASLAKKNCGLSVGLAAGDTVKYQYQATSKELVLSQADISKSCKAGEKMISHFNP
jgi:hypothetical protein